MYKIVYLKNGMKQDELSSMWGQVFGDDAAFTGGFYQAFDGHMDIVAAMDEQGILASAAHFIPVSMRMGKCLSRAPIFTPP